MQKIILMMIDGFGIPSYGWEKSVYDKYCSNEFIEFLKIYSVPIDACLGVEGIPQSATGQTSMFTGINAAKYLGRHYAAFPGKKLKELIAENNILKKVRDSGKKTVFANAYLKYELEKIYYSRFCSVTTAMTYSMQNSTFNTEDLIDSKCVYHDITNWTIDKKLTVPVITPEAAADNLMQLSKSNDLTLFEYFLTDRAGHSGKVCDIEKVLTDLSYFILRLKDNLQKDMALVITSDHGNIEVPDIKTHTLNKVPFIVYGLEKNIKYDINSIVGIYGFILKLLFGN